MGNKSKSKRQQAIRFEELKERNRLSKLTSQAQVAKRPLSDASNHQNNNDATSSPSADALPLSKPTFPTEVIDHILSYLPPDSRSDFYNLSLTSRAFHAATEKALYQVPPMDLRDPSALPLFAWSLELNPNLGSVVRGLTLHECDREGTLVKRIFGIVEACKDNLEELEMADMSLERVADLLAIPTSLRVAHLRNCDIDLPSSSSDVPPSNSIQHLAVHECRFSPDSLPPFSFPNLVSFSYTDPERYDFYHSIEFLLTLPPTLKALRIHVSKNLFEGEWDEDDADDAPVRGPTRKEWARAFRFLMALEVLECDYKDFCHKDRSELEILDVVRAGAELSTLRLHMNHHDTDWERKLKSWVEYPEDAPRCFATLDRVEVYVDGTWADTPDKYTLRKREELQALFEEFGVELLIEEGRYAVYPARDPFWDEFMGDKRWIVHH